MTLQREWRALEETARIRREAAGCLLEHLVACLPSGSRGTDLLAETTLGKLLHAIESDLVLKSSVRNPAKLLDRALLWLHELEVIRLNKGLAVFRPAMTIRLEQRDRRGFAGADFEPLALHYKGQVLQIHVMVEFAERGLAAMTDALRLAMDYFNLEEEEFLRRWLPGRDREIGRQTTPESWRAIVESLKNPVQQRIVADDREQTNVLVLAGPGSGKTRVLVHRIAYLVRARRENPRGILALAYNRHAAVDIRRRLAELIGDDARGVTVLTCHALAMRLAGASFTGRAERPDDELFREVLQRAVELLGGEGLPPEEADERRERLLAGFRWILVDEYQDIGPDQYALISALAGRTLDDEAGKLTLFAVGDDDQNIYAFNGASVEFIRRFEADYGPRPTYLTGNYRSTGHIIAAANTVVEPARERMKARHPLHIDRARVKDPPGGAWQELDPVSRGRVQILPAGRNPVPQARTAMAELLRLAALSPDWDWSRCAVIAREWEYLVPVRAFCEAHGIPAQAGNEEIPNFWRLRETRAFIEWLRGRKSRVVDGAALHGRPEAETPGPWLDLLRQAIDEFVLETGGGETPVGHFIEWLAEWGRDIRRRQRGLLLLTAHRAKGLEFDHVAILDGGWNRTGRAEDPDDARRLYYVAMTRARETLALVRFDEASPLTGCLARQSFGDAPQSGRASARPRGARIPLCLADSSRCGSGLRGTPEPRQSGASRHRRAVDRRSAGNAPCGSGALGAAGRGGDWWWGALPRASRRRTRDAVPGRQGPGGCGDGAEKHRSHNTATLSNATPGRWSFPSWCSSRTNSYNAAFDDLCNRHSTVCKAGIESRVEGMSRVCWAWHRIAGMKEPSRNSDGHFTDSCKGRAREMHQEQEENTMRSVLFLMAAACLDQWPLAAATAGAQASCSDWNTKTFFVPAGVADVSRCLKAGAEVNARDKFGRTPLHWAATYSNSPAVVTALLKAGAEVSTRGRKKGLMPIHAAAYSRLPQIVTVLAQAGADVNAGMEDGTTALHAAAWFSQTPAVVTALLDAGAIRHPAGPACPSRGSDWCVRTTDRASRVAPILLFHACCRHYPGGIGRCLRRSLPNRWQPSPENGRVGSHVASFEACSAFSSGPRNGNEAKKAWAQPCTNSTG